jgi:hypothetical protein
VPVDKMYEHVPVANCNELCSAVLMILKLVRFVGVKGITATLLKIMPNESNGDHGLLLFHTKPIIITRADGTTGKFARDIHELGRAVFQADSNVVFCDPWLYWVGNDLDELNEHTTHLGKQQNLIGPVMISESLQLLARSFGTHHALSSRDNRERYDKYIQVCGNLLSDFISMFSGCMIAGCD